MKKLIVIGTLLFLILVTFIYVANNAAHIAEGHNDETDIENANLELQRFQNLMIEYANERTRLVSAAYAGAGFLDNAISGMTTLAISSVANAAAGIANALGLTLQAFLIEHGSSELGSFIDSIISDANIYTQSIDYLYNNTTRLSGVDSANSAMEAYMDVCTATDHYNDHHSDQRNPPNPPNKPIDPNLPNFSCPGAVCGNTYTTVYTALNDHYKKCGTGDDVDTYNLPDVELENRTVSEGCGREWYSCRKPEDEEKTELHQVRICTKLEYRYDSFFKNRVQKSKCSESYRVCLKKKHDHDPRKIGKTLHSDEADSNDGDQETDGYVAPSPTPTPSYHTCGTHETTVSGNHESAVCGTSGHYQCDSKTHTTAVCGTSGHYDCDDDDHSMQASCLINSSCSVANFYKCQSHTCQATCAAGHAYDPNRANQANYHRTRTCRFEECRQTWQGCGTGAPICNKESRKRRGQSCYAEAI